MWNANTFSRFGWGLHPDPYRLGRTGPEQNEAHELMSSLLTPVSACRAALALLARPDFVVDRHHEDRSVPSPALSRANANRLLADSGLFPR